MMNDTSELYIKMSDCPEIQRFRGKGRWQAWDCIWATNYSTNETPKREMLVVSGYETDNGYYGPTAGGVSGYPEDERVPDDAIWLPYEHQLQEMISGDIYQLLKDFNDWRLHNHYCKLGDEETFRSMQQLWEAYYMGVEHEKIWSGNKWIVNWRIKA